MNWGDARLPASFWDRVAPEPNSGCWLWLGSMTHDGYGRFGKPGLAHRRTFFASGGRVERGDHLDHLCRVRCCVNPAHLDPVTAKENVRRGSKGVLCTHCPQGHAYDDQNTYILELKDGTRRRCCRACNRAASSRRRDRIAGQVVA